MGGRRRRVAQRSSLKIAASPRAASPSFDPDDEAPQSLMTTAATTLRHKRPLSERIIERLLFGAAALGVVTTISIIAVLAFETLEFFAVISPIDFFTGTKWSALIKPQSYGVLALISGTLSVTVIALIIAVPLGLLAATLLSEYASPRFRNVVKPLLDDRRSSDDRPRLLRPELARHSSSGRRSARTTSGSSPS